MHKVVLFCTISFLAQILPYQQYPYGGQCPYANSYSKSAVEKCFDACLSQTNSACYSRCSGTDTACQAKCDTQLNNCDSWCESNC